MAKTDAEKLATIKQIVDKYRAGDPYHAGRVAYAMRVDAALGSMDRIHEVLEDKER